MAQARPDRYSLSTQRELCEQKALELGATEIEHLEDAYTGTELSRPAMVERLRNVIRTRSADAVVFFDVDRIGRDALDILTIHREISSMGVQMHFALGGWENTPNGKLLLQIRAALSEHEHSQILERTSRGKNKKAASGRIRTWIRLYGYRFVKGEGILVVDPRESAIVRQMFEWCANEDAGSLEIARRLAERGIPSPRAGMKTKDGVVAGVWHYEQVWAMLHNATYVDGVIRRKYEQTHWAPLRVDPLVDRDLWDRAQAVCAKRRKFRRTDSMRGEFLLQTIIACGRCGHAMTIRTVARNHQWAYYYCPNHYGHAYDPSTMTSVPLCPQMPIKSTVADDAVWSLLSKAALNPDLLIPELSSERDIAHTALGTHLAEAEQRLKHAEQALTRANDAWVAGYMDQVQYQRISKEWRTRHTQAKADMDRASRAMSMHQHARQGAASVRRLAEEIARVDLSFAERQTLVRSVCRRVVLTDDDLRVEGLLPLVVADGCFSMRLT